MKATIKKSRSTDKQIVVTNGTVKIAEMEGNKIKPTGKLNKEQIKKAIHKGLQAKGVSADWIKNHLIID